MDLFEKSEVSTYAQSITEGQTDNAVISSTFMITIDPYDSRFFKKAQ